MKFPNKVNRYKTTTISKMIVLLDAIEEPVNGILELYKKVAKFMNIQDFIDALTCLYAIGKIDKVVHGGLEKCSKR